MRLIFAFHLWHRRPEESGRRREHAGTLAQLDLRVLRHGAHLLGVHSGAVHSCGQHVQVLWGHGVRVPRAGQCQQEHVLSEGRVRPGYMRGVRLLSVSVLSVLCGSALASAPLRLQCPDRGHCANKVCYCRRSTQWREWWLLGKLNPSSSCCLASFFWFLQCCSCLKSLFRIYNCFNINRQY